MPACAATVMGLRFFRRASFAAGRRLGLAPELLARPLGNVFPLVGGGVLLRLAGTRVLRRAAIVLPGLGHAVALLRLLCALGVVGGVRETERNHARQRCLKDGLLRVHGSSRESERTWSVCAGPEAFRGLAQEFELRIEIAAHEAAAEVILQRFRLGRVQAAVVGDAEQPRSLPAVHAISHAPPLCRTSFFQHTRAAPAAPYAG